MTAAAARRLQPGFTLIELLLVLLVVAVATGVLTLAMRDRDADRLAEEGARLAALLEMARAESRASGTPVWWQPLGATPGLRSAGGAADSQFRFSGLTVVQQLPTRWLAGDEVAATVLMAQPATPADRSTPARQALRLGPEAILPPQAVELRLGEQRLRVASDGLAPFAVDTTVAAALGDGVAAR